jgi:hypothetical protein
MRNLPRIIKKCKTCDKLLRWKNNSGFCSFHYRENKYNMEKEIKAEKSDLEKLRDTAKEIISNAKRDYLLWSAVLEQVEIKLKNAK